MFIRVPCIIIVMLLSSILCAKNTEITSSTMPGYSAIGSPVNVDTIEACRDRCATNKSCVRYFVKFVKNVEYSCIITSAAKDASVSNIQGYSYYDYTP